MNREQQEFESILVALGERELSDWERQRLWQLIAGSEERQKEYLNTLRIQSQLEDMHTGPILNEGSEVRENAPTRKASRNWLAAGLAAAAAIALLAVVPKALQQKDALADKKEIDALKGVNNEEPTPEESYENMLLAGVSPGSQNRPPTTFASLNPSDAASLPENAEVGFNEHIRPILSEYCFACHGFDPHSREADLRLDTLAGALSNYAVVPGKPNESEIIARIFAEDQDEIMPPPKSHKVMKPEEKELLVRWIAAGAEWQNHWAFEKPERPELPELEEQADWPINEIDHFALKGMQEKGFEPNPQADRYDLARRAALDLTGLPADPAAAKAFVADESPDAWEKYIDSLLASPHYGEHQARFWLDAARYGDTHGMHNDNYREMWPYRDWVVNAFNENMPFDQFTIEQLAGDLLPNATKDQQIASGFNRCNVTTAEGGSIPEELAVRYMVDRVETTSTVFLGLTSSCAACHDHKYDPISQKEFYQMGAFFNNTTSPAMDGNQKDHAPVVVLPKEEHEAEWNQIMTRRAELRQQLEKIGQKTEAPEAPKALVHPILDTELVFHAPLTGRGKALEIRSRDETLTVPMTDKLRPEDKENAKEGVRFVGNGGFEVPFAGGLQPSQPFTLSFRVRTPDKVKSSVLFEQIRTTKVEGDEEKTIKTGWNLTVGGQGNVTIQMFDNEGKYMRGLLPGDEALTPTKWQHVVVRYGGGQASSSFEIFVDGEERVLRQNTEQFVGGRIEVDVPLRIGHNADTAGLSDVRLFKRWASDEEIRLLAQERSLEQALAKAAAERDEGEKALVDLYARHVLNADYRRVSQQFAKTETRRSFIYARSVTSMVMGEREDMVPVAYVLERGEYDQKREQVTPGVPAALPPLPEGAPNNRLGFAQWLVHEDHPLTARVMVNRVWQSFFGFGLVKTAEDFGIMGERPTHPELLDWLAVEFRESGWDMKHLVRLIVTSQTYQQDGAFTSEKRYLDPDNRFLARGPRLRLDAEVLRDQALAVSDLMITDMGGPGVKPYQPDGLWKVVAIVGSNTKQFVQDEGEDLYRRSLYTFWKRTSPPPAMAAFNAPTREQCTVRRERTNTPLQALVLMNDPQFVEAARHLAERTMEEAEDDVARMEWMYQKVFARPLTEPSDAALLRESIAEFRAIFESDPEQATSLIKTGDSTPNEALEATELAAWTMIANTLMNRDDFINKS